MSVPAVLLDGVSASYEGHPALEDVGFQVPQGRFAALIGPNGAGKSTCLRLLLGLVRPTAGRVEVFGHPPLTGDSDGVGYVPQKVTIPRGLPIAAQDIVLMGRTAARGPGRLPSRRDRELARTSLDQVGLADLAARRFQDLSGGQQQRVLIARALCAQPRLLLMDEPTAGLDSAARARFYALVCDLQHARGLTLLCATHDLDVVGEHADSIILLDRTVRAQGTPAEVMSGGRLEQAYHFPAHHVHQDHAAHGTDPTATSGTS
ncbi:MAG: metal ABC transporter ATP-binding protein [Gemmatimonadetes bacterium]|nr:metal ABC transporter ATP-binding protein [Gemmatimonadota bacterium]